jgi:hypothetical protein
VLPLWVYAAVAATIAALAFGIGQIVPGFGVALVLFASTFWTFYAVRLGRRKAALSDIGSRNRQ